MRQPESERFEAVFAAYRLDLVSFCTRDTSAPRSPFRAMCAG
jgi:hypothetical protein